MNKAKALLIGLMCKLKPEHELVSAYLHDNEAHEQLLRGDVTLTKEDLFAPLPNGKMVFEYKDLWENFSVINGLLARNNEALTPEDLNRTATGKTLLKFAEDKTALDQLFTPEIWKGRMAEMEKTWHTVTSTERKKYDYLKICRAVAAAEGIELREDHLLKLGTDSDKIKGAIRSGGTTFADLVKLLESKGDHLRKADIFVLDSSSETTMDAWGAWNHFETWYTELEKNNEAFTEADWLRIRGTSKTPLALASQHSALPKIFTPQRWAHDPDGMMRLFEHVPADKKSVVDIQDVLNKIIEANFGAELNIEGLQSHGQLFAPLPGPTIKDHEGASVAIQPLMLKKVWDNFSNIREKLQSTGTDLTLGDLRRSVGLTHDTLLHIAVRNGHLDEVLKLARDNGDMLTIEDLTVKNRRDQTLLDEIVKQSKVKALFSPELWVGRADDMIKTWALVPEASRKDIEFKPILARVNQLNMRRQFGEGRAPGLGLG